MLFDGLICSGSEFQREVTATEKARVTEWVLTLGTDNKWKPYKRWPLGSRARENMENKYIKSSEERWAMINNLKMIRHWTDNLVIIKR